MGEPQSNSGQSPESSGRKWGLLILALFAGVIMAAILANWGDRGQGGANGNGSDPDSLLALSRTALSATENLAIDEAEAAWQAIYEQSPEDESALRNRALNRVLKVDLLWSEAMDRSSPAEKQRAARSQLPAAIDAARESIAQYEQVSGDSVTAMWLQSRIDLHEADLLPASMTAPLQREVFDKLVAAISGPLGNDEQATILAGPLTDVLLELEDPSAGLPQPLRQPAVEALAKLTAENRDNLFLAIQAARMGILSEDPRAGEWIERTWQLARSIEPTLDQPLKPIGFTAEQLVSKIKDAIAAGNWGEAEQNLQFWINVLNPTELVKLDRRRVSPHPLDQLSFESFRRLAASEAEENPIAKGTAELRFEALELVDAGQSVAITPIDFDLDLDDDLASVSNRGELRLWRNDGEGQWSPAGKTAIEDFETSGMLAIDLFMVDESHPGRLKTQNNSATFRHNAFPSLVVYGDAGVRVYGVDGRDDTQPTERLSRVESTGLEEVRDVTAVVGGDLDGDGDLDLVVAGRDRVRVFVNRGNRTFFEAPLSSPVDPAISDDPVATMAIVDLDRDLDLDVVTAHPKSGRVRLLENLLHLQFRVRSLDGVPTISGANTIAVADVDANVSWDLVVGGSEQVAVVFSQTASAGVWAVESVETANQPAASGVLSDFDNDSWSDLLASANQLVASRMGPWGIDSFAPVMDSSFEQLATANVDSDGRVDAVGLSNGIPTILLNRTESDGNFLKVRFRGIADNAANSGRVNHFGIGSVLELRFGPHYRAEVVTSPATHFGLGPFEQASSVRIILPNGLTQTIRDPAINTLVEEEQKLKGSCPYLYAWDGEQFTFMTDCLWAAPLGLQVARGVVAKDRPWEYLKLDGRDVRPRDGRYEFRITEELWEVAYIDKVALAAVDHPADVEIWTNEKVGPAEIAKPVVYAFRDREKQQLLFASDTAGTDVTETLRHQDRDFVQGFDRRLRQGLCPPHWIDLTFDSWGTSQPAGDQGTADRSKPAVYLVLTGWILPTDTSLNIQIDQNPELPAVEFPSVWVPDADSADGWREAIPFMGFPGGKTKTIVVDVSEVISRQDPRLRIRTSAQIYWDSAELVVQHDRPEFHQQPLKLLAAEVGFHGFSARIDGGPREPESYDYQNAVQSAIWPPLRGGLSGFGNCLERIRRWDDSMVVISSGDEIRLQFATPGSDLPEGWKRDFILHCVGWDKDADLNTLAGQSTEPLPFREMTAYPPVTSVFAANPAAGRDKNQLRRFQSFRSFWYRSGSADPARFTPIDIDRR